MATKLATRSNQTLRTITAQYKHEGRNPSVQAISTIYMNMLASDADEATWQLFHSVASLPLTTTKLVKSCGHGVNGDAGCKDFNVPTPRGNPCRHGYVPVTTLVQLGEDDHTTMDLGKVLNRQQIIGLWGRQLADALGGVYQSA